MDAERFMQHPEQLSMQYEELVRSINNNLRFILEAIKLDRGCVIEEGNENLLARRSRFWVGNGWKGF